MTGLSGPRRLVLGLLCLLLMLGGTAGCSQGAEGLRDFAEDEFNDTSAPGSTEAYMSNDSVDEVTKKFVEFRNPIDTYDTEGRTFLRYPDAIVAIIPQGSGTRIEIDGSRTGRRRNVIFLGGIWGSASSYTDVNRGGGPGSGK